MDDPSQALSSAEARLASGDTAPMAAIGEDLSAQSRFKEAIACFARILALRPQDPAASRGIAAALVGFADRCLAGGALPQAVSCCTEALRFAPGLPGAHLRRGRALRALGEAGPAQADLEAAVAGAPTDLEALMDLADLHARARRHGPAEDFYRRALVLDPLLVEANLNLASVLEEVARLEEAQALRARAPRPQPLVVEEAERRVRTVLVPWATGAGNVPIDTLIPTTVNRRIKWLAECATDAQEEELPECDVIFNAIGNADVAPFSRERLERLHRRRPMLNPPDRVLGTRRDLMAGLFEGIPGLLAPRTLRVSREEARAPGAWERLRAAGMEAPVIVRPIGTQGGEGARKVEDPEGFAQAVAGREDAFYVIAYHDYAGTDGFYRKYRVVFVDRVPFPYHLAISRKWLVHYYSAEMLSEPWKRGEERRFMEDPEGVLGAAAWATLDAMARRMDLDYGGADFSLLPDGRVLVFEANATMFVHLKDGADLFPYKHAVVPAIFRAFEAMLARHSGRRAGP